MFYRRPRAQQKWYENIQKITINSIEKLITQSSIPKAPPSPLPMKK